MLECPTDKIPAVGCCDELGEPGRFSYIVRVAECDQIAAHIRTGIASVRGALLLRGGR